MIDESKNVCYLIKAYYKRNGTDQYVKIISRHSQTTKRFKAFLNDYFTNVFPVSERRGNRGASCGTVTTQKTISKEHWQSKEIRDYVMDGITEKEKCY